MSNDMQVPLLDEALIACGTLKAFKNKNKCLILKKKNNASY